MQWICIHFQKQVLSLKYSVINYNKNMRIPKVVLNTFTFLFKTIVFIVL